MFDKLKQLNELRKMKKAIEAETVTGENGDVKITLSGDFKVQNVVIESEILEKNKLQREIEYAFNDAVKKVQMALASKFQGMM
ncbi:MAG: YbaB/EbfC family nucleoid-associated protein [bacterium]|nr:YbaB/EbfC family nucleoid-associated protein [bacterium]